MADACDPRNLPAGMDLVASYVDGRCASDRDDPVRISALATDAGNVGDCEPENPTPALWVDWVQRRRDAGVEPSIYCADDSLSDFFRGYRHRDVVAAFAAAGVRQPGYWLILPGATAIPDLPNVYAAQVRNTIPPGYDLSLVADRWPGIDPDPAVSGGTMSTIAIAPRPDGSGLDSFGLAQDGTLEWEGDIPDWTPGADTALPAIPGAQLRGVAAGWIGSHRLVVDVVDSSGIRHQNVLDISGGWSSAQWGAWEAMPGTWLVPVVGAPGAMVPQHSHAFTGTTGGPS